MEEMANLFDYVAEEEEQGTKFAPAEEFLDNLATAFNYDYVVATLPWGYMIYTNPVLNKAGKTAWVMYLIFLPLFCAFVGLIAKPKDSMGITKFAILFVWLLIVFFQIAKAVKSVKIVKTKQD